MEHPEYPGWTIRHRLLVDELPLLVLVRGDDLICISEGRYRQVVEFVLAIAGSAKEWQERPRDYADDINYKLHRGFVTEEGWAEGEGTFYGHLVKPEEYTQWLCDPDFVAELKRYEQRTGKTPEEPIWHISVSSGSWRGAARNLPKSSVEKLIGITRGLILGVLVMPESLDNEGAMARNSLAREGVNVLSEDEWDERFGWAASTGLRPSLLRKLETSATEYLEALRNKASNLEEKRACLLDGLSSANLLHRELSDGVFYQLEELGHRNLKICVDDPESVFLSEGTS